MDEIRTHYACGQHAALRGCWRVLCIAPTPEHRAAWYEGFDSVPSRLRGIAPMTGPIPQSALDLLASCAP